MPTPPPASIVAQFQDLEDPRVSPATRHQLLDIVAIALCAVLCGADTWVAVAAFGRAKAPWLRPFLALPHGIPAHNTVGRVFAALDPDQFAAGFRAGVATVAEVTAGVVAIDGKTLRRSHDHGQGQDARQWVSAWAAANRLVLGQVAVAPGSNEIPAIPAWLPTLALAGCLVTVAAAGWQTAIAAQIAPQGADDVLALQENQPPRHAAVTSLDPDGAWPGLRSVARVVAEHRIGTEVAGETRSYLSSLPGDATRIGAAVRDHWGSENRLHWVLAIAFREAESRVRQGHADPNLAILRRLALTLLRQETTATMGGKAKRLKAGWDDAYLLKTLAT